MWVVLPNMKATVKVKRNLIENSKTIRRVSQNQYSQNNIVVKFISEKVFVTTLASFFLERRYDHEIGQWNWQNMKMVPDKGYIFLRIHQSKHTFQPDVCRFILLLKVLLPQNVLCKDNWPTTVLIKLSSSAFYDSKRNIGEVLFLNQFYWSIYGSGKWNTWKNLEWCCCWTKWRVEWKYSGFLFISLFSRDREMELWKKNSVSE